MKSKFVFIVLFCLGLAAFSACTLNDSFEKNIPIPNDKWDYIFKPEYHFIIKDTTVLYTIFVNVRHLDAYGFMNMWVWVHLQQPDGQVTHQRVQLKLADAEGKWFGEGLNGIWMARFPIKELIPMHNQGEYVISLEQDMRINPLPAVMAMGIKVQRSAIKRTIKKTN